MFIGMAVNIVDELEKVGSAELLVSSLKRSIVHMYGFIGFDSNANDQDIVAIPRMVLSNVYMKYLLVGDHLSYHIAENALSENALFRNSANSSN